MEEVTEVIKRHGLFDLVYAKTETNTILIRYDLLPGYKLYVVHATYARGLRMFCYYVAARNPREAKSRFLERLSWLDVIKYIHLLSEEESKRILHEPRRHIIF